jgi:hypothetical protein
MTQELVLPFPRRCANALLLLKSCQKRVNEKCLLNIVNNFPSDVTWHTIADLSKYEISMTVRSCAMLLCSSSWALEHCLPGNTVEVVTRHLFISPDHSDWIMYSAGSETLYFLSCGLLKVWSLQTLVWYQSYLCELYSELCTLKAARHSELFWSCGTILVEAMDGDSVDQQMYVDGTVFMTLFQHLF